MFNLIVFSGVKKTRGTIKKLEQSQELIVKRKWGKFSEWKILSVSSGLKSVLRSEILLHTVLVLKRFFKAKTALSFWHIIKGLSAKIHLILNLHISIYYIE